MASGKGKRITELKAAKTVPNGGVYPMELPGGTGTRKVSQATMAKEVYGRLQYGTDADVDAIIAGTYEDPSEDEWGDDDGNSDDGTGGGSEEEAAIPPMNLGNAATDQEVDDYLNNLNLFN